MELFNFTDTLKITDVGNRNLEDILVDIAHLIAHSNTVRMELPPDTGNADDVVLEKRVMLRFSAEMEVLLVMSILAANARKSSSAGTNQMKFTRIVDALWENPIFSTKGPKKDWSTIRNKYLSMLNSFKRKVGLGSTVVNCSALPNVEDLPEVEGLLFEICRDEETALAETLERKESKEDEAAIKDAVTDAVTSGGGGKKVGEAARQLADSKPKSAKYKKFSMGFGSPGSTSSSSSATAPESSKKTRRDSDEVDKMQDFLSSFAAEAANDEKNDQKILDYMEVTSSAIQTQAETTASSNTKLTETMDMLGKSILHLSKKRG